METVTTLATDIGPICDQCHSSTIWQYKLSTLLSYAMATCCGCRARVHVPIESDGALPDVHSMRALHISRHRHGMAYPSRASQASDGSRSS